MGRLPALALLFGTLAVSTAPPLILLAGVQPFALAAWRLLSVGVILLPFAAGPLARDLKQLKGRECLWLLASGITYGLHFGLFNLAFAHTSKESVVVLLGVQPLMAAGIGAVWLKEELTRRMLLASAIAIAGLTIFVWHDYTFDASHLVGDALVLASGLAIVLSYSAGRRLRPRMSLPGYLSVLYWVAGLTCLCIAVATGNTLWGYTNDQWMWLGLAVLIPTLVGHSLFHYVVKYVPVFFVNLTILGEPILSLVIMYLLRNEYAVFRDSTLTTLQLIGGSLLMLGVVFGIWKRRPKPLEVLA
ncbi:MAG: DMT family transporter [Planctomycetes bacterium]|nr:DMT family transporter [Planctomycetota bacterium]